ncbi:DNA/RNA polymerase superfamily protein [Gossypium australe]|uniref:DNA/RNA polymerase superfamily protein n=1 Tax=Gossypium australe TaxID=47621 RepID=A0A5B6UV90_9ROSI|nr:DNA/RNA polymerase superfamily protein [Gossypium australe]
MNTWLALSDDGSILAELRARPMFLQEICEAQKGDSDLQAKRVQCESVKAEHQVPSSLLHPVMVLEWKWDKITIDFVTGLPLTQKEGCLVSNAFVLDRTQRKSNSQVDLVRENEEKVKVIRDCLKAASDRQKSYTGLKRKEIEFQVGDKVFLKVSPWKKFLRFGRKGKLSSRFIGPYEIIERMGPVAYRLAFPLGLENIHDVFHMSMLRHYRSDPSHVISPTKVEIRQNMTYGEEPVKILAREVKQLRNKV